MPNFELPEWADFEDSPLKHVADRYNEIKAKWAERDRMDLAELRRRFGSLNLGWERFLADKGQLWLDSSMLNKFTYTGTDEEQARDIPKSGKLFRERLNKENLDRLFSMFGPKPQKSYDNKVYFV